jgi:hypothetical protein
MQLQYTVVVAHGGGTVSYQYARGNDPAIFNFPLGTATATASDSTAYQATLTSPNIAGNYTIQLKYDVSSPAATYYQCLDACVPSCAGKECGPDGCGGVCGTCATGLKCNVNRCNYDGSVCRDSFFYGDKKGKSPSAETLLACAHHNDRTCCSAKNSGPLDKLLCVSDMYSSSKCKFYSELLSCVVCNPDFGMGKRTYPSRTLCDNLYEACKNEKFFRYDYPGTFTNTETEFFRIDDKGSQKASELFSGPADFFANMSIVSFGLQAQTCYYYYDSEPSNDPLPEETIDSGVSIVPQFALMTLLVILFTKFF